MKYLVGLLAAGMLLCSATVFAQQTSKPNIVLIVSDDFGYGDSGPYGGGIGRGMPTPNLDKMADEGMTFFSFYAQPSCTPGRAAMQTGRFPNRSGMTTVAFQGQGGGLPKAEWTLGSQLKTAGYKTYFTGKWHLGEADYALPNAHGYDVMKYMGIYHLNAYTYGDPEWFPDMPDSLRAMFNKVTKGMMSGNAGETAHEDFKVNGEYVDTPVIDGKEGVVGIPFLDAYIEKAALEFLDDAAKTPNKPFFINVNFMKVHQPNLPHPDFIHKSMSKSKFADSIVENDTRIGHIMDKLHQLGLDKGNTLVIWTTDNGAWQDVYPDAGYTPFRGTKGTDREGGNRVPAIAWMPGKIKAGSRNYDIVGGLDFMATFSALAGIQAARKGSRRSADDLRQLRHVTGAFRHGQEPARNLVTTSPRTNFCPAPSAGTITSSCSTFAAMTVRRLAVWPWIPTSVGKVLSSMSRPCRKSSTCGPTHRSATICS